MRYRIVNNQVQESMFLDAPYDTKADALSDLSDGIKHNCERCDGETCLDKDYIKLILDTIE